MNYKIESGKGPAYLQIYMQIKQDVVDGTYAYGSKLPSKRLLCEETGVSIITVEHAYDLLIEEGYVESRERSGYFVVFRSSDGFAASSRSYPVFHAHPSSHATEAFPFSVLARSMRKVLADYGEALLEKAPNAGCVELREALRSYLQRNKNIVVETDQIVIGSGAEYLYGLIVELLGRDLVYGIESPSYAKIEQVYCAENVKYEPLPLTSDGIDSYSLSKTKATVLHVSPYRSYPTGVTASASKRHEYVRWASASGRYIIEDDFESEFSLSPKAEDTLFSLSKGKSVIYLNTFSKTISPSLRIGYMVLPKSLVDVFEKRLGFYSCTVPTYEQYLLTELIEGGAFERHINRVRRALRKDRLS